MRSFAVLALLLCIGCSPAAEPAPDETPHAAAPAHREIPVCNADFAQLLGDEVFREYAVPVTARRSPPAEPDVSRGKPRLYRTVIREQARRGPNFAGHYTIISIGCGSASTCLAIADAITGEVFFPANLKGVGDLLVMIPRGPDDYDRLNFRRDSRLLVVRGAPDSDLERVGLSYFEWRDARLNLVRYIPAGELCGLSEEEQYWLRTPTG